MGTATDSQITNQWLQHSVFDAVRWEVLRPQLLVASKLQTFLQKED